MGNAWFNYCTGLVHVTIPKTVSAIAQNTFRNCNSLTDITFMGTKAEWKWIGFGAEWNYGMPSCTVHCTDGDITV